MAEQRIVREQAEAHRHRHRHRHTHSGATGRPLRWRRSYLPNRITTTLLPSSPVLSLAHAWRGEASCDAMRCDAMRLVCGSTGTGMVLRGDAMLLRSTVRCTKSATAIRIRTVIYSSSGRTDDGCRKASHRRSTKDCSASGTLKLSHRVLNTSRSTTDKTGHFSMGQVGLL
ncbi:uncharacterized protein MYCFIDRAFT_211259 [Pseudocercospora fijiensis CIRAD86]|uniref:Uncharacterized protein n=1 Tax=Pseudocercospora fijiensis (strain CIRAD86) TaxID=383855 RepID=M2YZV9_PSEFD|nr:uncharacterized protein MYCFIDRAFT_211259 [Pseudocercospora fijiensis CIRAD86]EME83155.1 hypothetical protein MYCFIDRAFT_211259 [Pseudocercospora fijiensis CIRAD86]